MFAIRHFTAKVVLRLMSCYSGAVWRSLLAGIFLFLPLSLLGCQATTLPSPTPTLARPALARVTAVPPTFPRPTIQPTAGITSITASPQPILPTPPPLPTAVNPTSISGAAFANLRMATAVDALPQSIFPAGIEEIYALWDYHNMSGAERVMRLWLQNGQPWKAFEEPWAMDRYGVNGTVTDTFIYDYEGSGIPSGHYVLQLYIDGEYQGQAAFEILN